MNTQKTVFNKIAKLSEAKVDLSEAQKVKLGLLQDIESDYNFILSNFNNAENKFYDALGIASSNQKFISINLYNIN